MPAAASVEIDHLRSWVGVGRPVRVERRSVGMPLILFCGAGGMGVAVRIWCSRRPLRWWVPCARLTLMIVVLQGSTRMNTCVMESPMGERA